MDLAEIRCLTIVALFSDDVLFETLVLKGGNAMSFVDGFNDKASIDLYFSIENDSQDVDVIRQRIFAALESEFDEAGYIVFDKYFGPRPHQAKPTAGASWDGYQLKFKLRETAKQLTP